MIPVPSLLKGVSVGLAVCFVLFALTAAVVSILLHFTDTSESSMAKWLDTGYFLFTFAGAAAAGLKGKKRGLLLGLILSVILLALSAWISGSLTDWLLGWNRHLLTVAVSMLGGLAGVTVGSRLSQ